MDNWILIWGPVDHHHWTAFFGWGVLMFARRWKAIVGDKLAFDGHDWMSFQQLTTLPSALCFISFSSSSSIALIPIRFKHSNNIREIISTANCFNRLHYNINCISPPSVALHEVIKRVGRKTSKSKRQLRSVEPTLCRPGRTEILLHTRVLREQRQFWIDFFRVYYAAVATIIINGKFVGGLNSQIARLIFFAHCTLYTERSFNREITARRQITLYFSFN